VLIPEILDKIEVIVVNDGSHDKTQAIAEAYRDKFLQSVVLINKANGHYGSCINAALKIATGKYFRPLDADDWFDSKAFVYYVTKLQNISVDMVLTNYSTEYGKKVASHKMLFEKDVKNMCPEQENDFLRHNFGNAQKLFVMHAVTYRTEVLHTANLRCSEGICYTDSEYIFYPLEYVKTFTYINIVLYKYYVERDGQSVSIEATVKNRNHYYLILSRIIEYLAVKNNCLEGQARNLQYMKLGYICRYYYSVILCHVGRNPDDNKKLATIDAGIKKLDEAFYDSLNNYRWHKTLKYIYLWRVKNIYCCETKLFLIIRRMYGAARLLYLTMSRFFYQPLVK
jgi:glycosyltransferase involved in cell wall biosynthesis